MVPFCEDRQGPGEINPHAIAAALREKVSGEVRFSQGDRAMYSTDGSNYRQVPIGIVVPRDEEDLIRGMEICRDFGAPVLPRGGGTSLAGQCCNVAVVFDFSKYMHRILELNPESRYAWVQPGIINDSLRNAANQYTLTFGPDPATHSRCTIGGNIGNNSCGIHSVMAGKTSENVEELEILTYEGHQMRVGPTPEAELEFLWRYYKGRIRPRHANASGLIYRWARAASHAPALANLFTQAPWLSAIAKFGAGYSQERRLPPFAYETFRNWFKERPAVNEGKPEVMLWADTFSNYFQPEIAKAAVEVLEAAGWRVTVRASLCAAGGRSTTTACWIRPRRCCCATFALYARRSSAKPPSWCWSRAAPRFSATR